MRFISLLLVGLVGLLGLGLGVSAQVSPADCNLNYLLLTGGLQLSPFFSADTTSYTVNVPITPVTVQIQAWQANSGAWLTIQQQGGPLKAYIGGGNPSDSFTITQTTTIAITVTCTGCQKVYTITFNCGTHPPPPPSSTGAHVVGDPQFTGLRGQSFQVHGVAGEVYNIISDVDLQVNSKFVFLTKGDCPIINGVRAKGCFSHPGSYLGEIGIKTSSGDKIKLIAGKAATGFDSVSVNGRSLKVDDSVSLTGGAGSVSRNGSHVVSVTAGNFAFVFENSDLYINQRVRVLDWSALGTVRSNPHGLLGQTWSGKRYPSNAIKDIMGDVDDYLVEQRDLFGDQFTYNQFKTNTKTNKQQRK